MLSLPYWIRWMSCGIGWGPEAPELWCGTEWARAEGWDARRVA